MPTCWGTPPPWRHRGRVGWKHSTRLKPLFCRCYLTGQFVSPARGTSGLSTLARRFPLVVSLLYLAELSFKRSQILITSKRATWDTQEWGWQGQIQTQGLVFDLEATQVSNLRPSLWESMAGQAWRLASSPWMRISWWMNNSRFFSYDQINLPCLLVAVKFAVWPWSFILSASHQGCYWLASISLNHCVLTVCIHPQDLFTMLCIVFVCCVLLFVYLFVHKPYILTIATSLKVYIPKVFSIAVWYLTYS